MPDEFFKSWFNSKKASTSVATEAALKFNNYILYNMTAQIYYKVQNAYAISENQQYKFVSHTCLEKR